MADIELRERLWGGGFVGHVNVTPTLSWADSAALRATAANSAAAAANSQMTAMGVQATMGAVQRLGWELSDVASAIDSLSEGLGYALATQTAIMERQAADLEGIHD